MNNNNGVFISLVLTILSTIQCYNYDNKPGPQPKDWDVLVFTQRWPITACSQWLQENKTHTCSLPIYDHIWTIHGIWPTKSGSRGPWNCNNSSKFNESRIASIESDLKQYWINVENNTKLTSLWEHEWQKHGTCATVLPQLNNELKYFSQGLEWIRMFNMKAILLNNQIIPNLSGYSVEILFHSIRDVLNHNPIVQCVVDKATKKSLISEIQICFDRVFNVIDCDPVKDHFEGVDKNGDVLTDCSLKKPVYYPSQILLNLTQIPQDSYSTNFADQLLETRNYWIIFYKTVKFLIWATI